MTAVQSPPRRRAGRARLLAVAVVLALVAQLVALLAVPRAFAAGVGVSGKVVSAATSSGIAGATVELCASYPSAAQNVAPVHHHLASLLRRTGSRTAINIGTGPSASCSTPTTTDADGAYSFSGVAPGPHTLWVYPPANTTYFTGNASPYVGTSDVIVPDIALASPTPLPGGTTLYSPSTGGYQENGVPTVHFQDVISVTTNGCANGHASITLTAPDGSPTYGFSRLNETPVGSGHYTGTVGPLYPHHGGAHVTITIYCPDESTQTQSFDIYIDPSGTVTHGGLTDPLAGQPLPGATVTLFSFDGETYTQVPNGSAIMSPGNRLNPDATGLDGSYGWDVIAGTYKVRVEKAGCHAVGNPAQSYVEIAPIVVTDEPITNLNTSLECPVVTTPQTATPEAGSSVLFGTGAALLVLVLGRRARRRAARAA